MICSETFGATDACYDRGTAQALLGKKNLADEAPQLGNLSFFFLILRRMGKNKSLTSHTSTYQIRVVSISPDAPVPTSQLLYHRNNTVPLCFVITGTPWDYRLGCAFVFLSRAYEKKGIELLRKSPQKIRCTPIAARVQTH